MGSGFRGLGILLWGSKFSRFRVAGSVFRVSGSGFRVSGFSVYGVWLSGFSVYAVSLSGFGVSRLGFLVYVVLLSGFGAPHSGFVVSRFRVRGSVFSSFSRLWVLGLGCRVRVLNSGLGVRDLVFQGF